MSIEALRWAMRQQTRNSSTQCLLLVLANAADPEGLCFAWWKSRDHWWPYLMEKTRLSRGSVFRLLGEFEDKGYLTRDETKPTEGGRAQPVIQLHLDRDVIEPEHPSDVQSTTYTEKAGRAGGFEAAESPCETHAQSTRETENPVVSPPHRLNESTRATTRDVPLGNPNSPQSPPLRGPKGLDELNGFPAFWAEYPDHQAMNRRTALAAFAELTSNEQEQAVRVVSLYARDIAKLKRRPVSAVNWLREKRFTEYGIGRQTAIGARPNMVLVPEGSEPWNAWCNLASVIYGGGQKIPYTWAAQGQRGAWRPTEWPPGGEAWNVPLSEWWFVEKGTAQYKRWVQRVHEIADRFPVLRQRSRCRPGHVAQATSHSGAAPPIDPQGLLVPLEWPPAKGSPKAENSLATDKELDEFAETG